MIWPKIFFIIFSFELFLKLKSSILWIFLSRAALFGFLHNPNRRVGQFCQLWSVTINPSPPLALLLDLFSALAGRAVQPRYSSICISSSKVTVNNLSFLDFIKNVFYNSWGKMQWNQFLLELFWASKLMPFEEPRVLIIDCLRFLICLNSSTTLCRLKWTNVNYIQIAWNSPRLRSFFLLAPTKLIMIYNYNYKLVMPPPHPTPGATFKTLT